MTPEQKAQIDDMDYESMLRLWRFVDPGNPLLQGETGIYFAESMALKRRCVDHVKISKRIGWDR